MTGQAFLFGDEVPGEEQLVSSDDEGYAEARQCGPRTHTAG